MKKILAALLMLALFCACALADEMLVVNCDEWVSLRAKPDTSSERLIKVPLYAHVYNCDWAGDDFTYCEYKGYSGYILSKYLEPCEPDEPEDPDSDFEEAKNIFDDLVNGVYITAERAYEAGGERVTVYGPDWSYTAQTTYITELTLTDVFANGNNVIVYCSTEGLISLDARTGKENWILSCDDVNLGGGITHAIAKDGTMYICGFYGPDPVAIDVNGQVLWQSDTDDPDLYWPYEMQLTSTELGVHYDSTDTWVTFSLDYGNVTD